MIGKFKRRISEIINPAEDQHTRTSRVFDVFIMSLIALNILAVILETVVVLKTNYAHIFYGFELFSVIIFSGEYISRMWTATYDPRYRHSVWGRIKYMFTPMALIDLIAVLPFYLPLVMVVDLRFMRILRMFRIFRVLKFGRYASSVGIMGKVLKSKKEELVIVMFVVLIMLIFASSFMYFVESKAQPEAFGSIPEAMWWGVATLTTVGYGDIYPITPWGKTFAAFITILGIGVFALPTGILASAFTDELGKRKRNNKCKCPHCEKEFEKD